MMAAGGDDDHHHHHHHHHHHADADHRHGGDGANKAAPLSVSRSGVPAAVYKTERPFLVALPPLALEILQRVPRWNEGDFVFSTEGGARPVWSIPRKIVDRLHTRVEAMIGHKIEHFVVHDFRRTARTHLSRLKVPEVVGELVLGHALRGVARTYNVYDFELEKREALTLWSTELRQQ
jgi:integrase